MGTISDVGRTQATSLGRWLRQRYSSPLPAQIRVHAAKHNRTLVTLQNLLGGLLPDVASEVSVSILAPDKEILYANSHGCEGLGMLLKKADQSTKRESRTHAMSLMIGRSQHCIY